MRSKRIEREGSHARISEGLMRHRVAQRRVLPELAFDRGLREQQAGEDLGQRADLEARLHARLVALAEQPRGAFAAVDPSDGEPTVCAGIDAFLQRLPVLSAIERLGARRRGGQQRKKYTKRFVQEKAGHGCGAYRNAVTKTEAGGTHPSRPCAPIKKSAGESLAYGQVIAFSRHTIGSQYSPLCIWLALS